MNTLEPIGIDRGRVRGLGLLGLGDACLQAARFYVTLRPVPHIVASSVQGGGDGLGEETVVRHFSVICAEGVEHAPFIRLTGLHKGLLLAVEGQASRLGRNLDAAVLRGVDVGKIAVGAAVVIIGLGVPLLERVPRVRPEPGKDGACLPRAAEHAVFAVLNGGEGDGEVGHLLGGGGRRCRAIGLCHGHKQRAIDCGIRVSGVGVNSLVPHGVGARVIPGGNGGGVEAGHGGGAVRRADGVEHHAVSRAGLHKLLMLSVVGESVGMGRREHKGTLDAVIHRGCDPAQGDAGAVIAGLRGRLGQLVAAAMVDNGGSLNSGDGAADGGHIARSGGAQRRGRDGQGRRDIALGAGGGEFRPFGAVIVFMHHDLIPVGISVDLVTDGADVVDAGLCEAEGVILVDKDAVPVQLLLLEEVVVIQALACFVLDRDMERAVDGALCVQLYGRLAHDADKAAADHHLALGIAVGLVPGDGDLKGGGTGQAVVCGKGRVCVEIVFVGAVDVLIDQIEKEAGSGADRRVAHIAGALILRQHHGGGTVGLGPGGAVPAGDDPMTAGGVKAVVGRQEAVQTLQLQIIGEGGISHPHCCLEIVIAAVGVALAADEVLGRGQQLHNGQRLRRRDLGYLVIGEVHGLPQGGAHRGEGDVGGDVVDHLGVMIVRGDIVPVNGRAVIGAGLHVKLAVLQRTGPEVGPAVPLKAGGDAF